MEFDKVYRFCLDSPFAPDNLVVHVAMGTSFLNSQHPIKVMTRRTDMSTQSRIGPFIVGVALWLALSGPVASQPDKPVQKEPIPAPTPNADGPKGIKELNDSVGQVLAQLKQLRGEVAELKKKIPADTSRDIQELSKKVKELGKRLTDLESPRACLTIPERSARLEKVFPWITKNVCVSSQPGPGPISPPQPSKAVEAIRRGLEKDSNVSESDKKKGCEYLSNLYSNLAGILNTPKASTLNHTLNSTYLLRDNQPQLKSYTYLAETQKAIQAFLDLQFDTIKSTKQLSKAELETVASVFQQVSDALKKLP